MKAWRTPSMDVLDIRMTMNGPGDAVPDCFEASEGRGPQVPDNTNSNASCLDKPGVGS